MLNFLYHSSFYKMGIPFKESVSVEVCAWSNLQLVFERPVAICRTTLPCVHQNSSELLFVTVHTHTYVYFKGICKMPHL